MFKYAKNKKKVINTVKKKRTRQIPNSERVLFFNKAHYFLFIIKKMNIFCISEDQNDNKTKHIIKT